MTLRRWACVAREGMCWSNTGVSVDVHGVSVVRQKRRGGGTLPNMGMSREEEGKGGSCRVEEGRGGETLMDGVPGSGIAVSRCSRVLEIAWTSKSMRFQGLDAWGGVGTRREMSMTRRNTSGKGRGGDDASRAPLGTRYGRAGVPGFAWDGVVDPLPKTCGSRHRRSHDV